TVLASSPDPLDQALQLAAHGAHLVFVLDNLDALRSSEARAGLQRLVHQAPAALSIVLLTRQDPGLRVDRLPSQATVHVRAADRAFTPSEVAALFAGFDNALGGGELDALTEWTGGLAAAVALAATVTREPAGRDRVLTESRDHDRAVCDYLTAEVLEHVSPE